MASRNLEIVLPDSTPEERRRILRATYDNIVWTGVEFIVLQNDPRQALDWVEAENEEVLDDRIGGILLACHVGNWELGAAWIAQRGHKVSAIFQESQDVSERGVIADMRANSGVNCIPKTAPMTRVLGVLKRNEFLAITPDQHGGGEGVTVPLFGLDTKTSQGPAVFAYLTKKPIIPSYIRRIAPFKHRVHFEEPVKWEDKGNREETILGITKAVNEAIERIILHAPDQWLAQHRRFREHY
ncbi:MAG: lysophospholipid acyltransferase family protein [Synergistaceae bacterium]|nr:lysophospholipid acyltransferase family protein [Synergistaceae bacterium]